MQHKEGLTPLAQKLRREMTKEEKQLWYQYLRLYPLTFRRQVSVDEYILDFYCSSAKLAVELDGSYHTYDEIVEEDKKRTSHLESRGIMVIRFKNKEIWQNFDKIKDQIDYWVKKRTQNN